MVTYHWIYDSVTCEVTAYRPGSAPAPMLVIENRIPLSLPLLHDYQNNNLSTESQLKPDTFQNNENTFIHSQVHHCRNTVCILSSDRYEL